jgi:glutamate racemase
METKPILIFDSGVGGLPYLEHAIKKLPNERFVYLADRKYFPYGEKKSGDIIAAVFEAWDRLFSRVVPKAAVVACNTASVIALSSLRERYPLPIVGVVPAVKPAAHASKSKRFGVLATPRTVEDSYLQNLIDNFADHCEVHIVPAPSIRDIVEKRFFIATETEKLELLKSVVSDLKKLDVDSVVLACTHFLHLIGEFKKVLGDGISIIDSRDGVVKQLARILETNHLLSSEKIGDHEFYLTGNPPIEKIYYQFADRYGLTLTGLI